MFLVVVPVVFVVVVPIVFIVVVPVVFIVVVPVVFIMVVPVVRHGGPHCVRHGGPCCVHRDGSHGVCCGGPLHIMVVHHCRRLSWRYILVVCVAIIRYSCVVLVHCHRHCPLLSSMVVVVHRGCGWWCVVVRRAGPHIVVICRCLWLWPCSSVVCFVLVSCGHSPFVRARSGEERAIYSPGSASAMPSIR